MQTKIHDPVVLSSGSIATMSTKPIAIAVGVLAIAAGTYAAYTVWKKGQQR